MMIVGGAMHKVRRAQTVEQYEATHLPHIETETYFLYWHQKLRIYSLLHVYIYILNHG